MRLGDNINYNDKVGSSSSDSSSDKKGENSRNNACNRELRERKKEIKNLNKKISKSEYHLKKMKELFTVDHCRLSSLALDFYLSSY